MSGKYDDIIALPHPEPQTHPRMPMRDRAAQFWRESRDFEAVFLLDSGEIYVTQGLEDSFRSERSFEVLAR